MSVATPELTGTDPPLAGTSLVNVFQAGFRRVLLGYGSWLIRAAVVRGGGSSESAGCQEEDGIDKPHVGVVSQVLGTNEGVVKL